MAERIRLDDEETELVEDDGDGGNYFANQNSPLQFIDSGCGLLNCVLGGGWPLGRVSNIVGDESTGKTLLAIEGMANFRRQFPKGRMFYRESESAFDEVYASALGMPVDHIDFVDPDKDFNTVEEFYEDLKRCADICRRKDVPGYYVLDSLDALSSKDEVGRDFNEGSYDTKKAKQMGKAFRLMVREVAVSNMHLQIVSQTRDFIGITFGGPKKTRSGGRALDFYSSQNLWLSQRARVKQTVKGIERVVGVHIRAQMKKSKIALPYRECDFTILFGHGIDSLASSLDWLKSVGKLDETIEASEIVPGATSRNRYENQLDKLGNADYFAEVKRVDQAVARIWREIEGSFLENVRRKYNDE